MACRRFASRSCSSTARSQLHHRGLRDNVISTWSGLALTASVTWIPRTEWPSSSAMPSGFRHASGRNACQPRGEFLQRSHEPRRIDALPRHRDEELIVLRLEQLDHGARQSVATSRIGHEFSSPAGTPILFAGRFPRTLTRINTYSRRHFPDCEGSLPRGDRGSAGP